MKDWGPSLREANEVLLVQGQISRVPDFFAQDYISNGLDGQTSGHGAIEGFLAVLTNAFSDLVVEIEVLHQNDSIVTWLRTHRATHVGEFASVPASGQVVEWQDMVVTRYRNGLIAEEWGVSGIIGALLAAS